MKFNFMNTWFTYHGTGVSPVRTPQPRIPPPDDAAPSVATMKLTPAALAAKFPDKPIPELRDADCSGWGIAHIDDISVALHLRKLNLAKNQLKAADALSGIKHNKEITWLNLAENKLENLDGLGASAGNLAVLNVSNNEVNRISHHVEQCTSLKALILNGNKIARIENLGKLAELNTLASEGALACAQLAVCLLISPTPLIPKYFSPLAHSVLSHNKISVIEGVGALKKLKKLSIAHNQIRLFPDLTLNPELTELRLNANKIVTVPDTVRFMPALELLDLGSNLIATPSDVSALASLHTLTNLNLKGNPITKKEGYREMILTLVPTLRVLDGERFDPKFLERKGKRKAAEEKSKKFAEWIQKVDEKKDEAAERAHRCAAAGGALKKGNGKRVKEEGDEGDEEAEAGARMDRPVAKRPRSTADGKVAPSGPAKAASSATGKRKRLEDQTESKPAALPKKRAVEPVKAKTKVKPDKRAEEADAADSFFLAEESAAPSRPAKAKPAGKAAPSSSKLASAARPPPLAKAALASKPSTASKPAPGSKPAAASKAAPVSKIPGPTAKKASASSKKADGAPPTAVVAPPAPGRAAAGKAKASDASEGARSGVVAVIEVKKGGVGKGSVASGVGAVTAFDPEAVAASARQEGGTALLVGGWD
ncbi:hypothetical protein BDK51DRAFT_36815 [Blyttiomyces helicus]|uniref:Uncharacterized protein n=1 Tax=Blyttiomyces helicus TaxID=388810 RepID=A0A4P9WGK2_9FUNG|nr:hypothetical protein BDK51DRAFT_36815 [Blyttiomyces helicus]|eukprot:RKO90508.1 hypothetical protein BDK51DRAFT_36815 [Blyttiomyces helicus]